jgi:hypothetical protein
LILKYRKETKKRKIEEEKEEDPGKSSSIGIKKTGLLWNTPRI